MINILNLLLYIGKVVNIFKNCPTDNKCCSSTDSSAGTATVTTQMHQM